MVGRGGGGKVPHCERRHCCTTGREASEDRWTVGRGGDNVLLHSSTAVLLDERMNLGGGKRRRRCPPSFKWGPKLRTLDEKVRMASTAMSSSTRALLDERLTSTAGWWAEAAAARYSFIRVELHYARRQEAREHCWAGGGGKVLLRSSWPEIAHAGREGKDGEHCNVHLHSSTAALLDERMDMGGRRQRRCPPLFQWGRNCARCGKDGEHCKVGLHSSTAALLDERLTSTAGR